MLSPIAQAAGRAGQSDLMPLWAGQNVPPVKRRSAAELMAFPVDDIDRVVSQTQRVSSV
ncbi:MAG TPA: hypothetical protein VK636_02105 [Gemmatimonadaceae bacterium]|nr:hypothetical protein [Gemmatimonadaceae bacterium]